MRTAGTLHERDSELAWLSEQIDGALAGGGVATAIEGEAGIGKSALLEVAARRAQDAGLRVLRARGAELERDFPYGVARQLFEPVLLAASPPERERLTAGPAGLAGEALTLSEPAGPVAGDRGPAVAHGLYWLAANLAAEQPVMLALDDAHWADAASLRSIAYLARRVEGMPLLLVWTLRPPEGAPDEARPPEPDTVLQPAPLSEAAAGAVVGEQLGEQRSGAFVRACHTATGGNPFLLHELLRAVGEQEGAGQEQLPSVAPATIRRATAARLRRLGLDEERLATSVAVLGGRARHRHAAALAGLAPDAATDAADRLAGAEILRDGRPLDFVHPIVLAAVREALAPGRRAPAAPQRGRDPGRRRRRARGDRDPPAGHRARRRRVDRRAPARGRGARARPRRAGARERLPRARAGRVPARADAVGGAAGGGRGRLPGRPPRPRRRAAAQRLRHGARPRRTGRRRAAARRRAHRREPLGGGRRRARPGDPAGGPPRPGDRDAHGRRPDRLRADRARDGRRRPRAPRALRPAAARRDGRRAPDPLRLRHADDARGRLRGPRRRAGRARARRRAPARRAAPRRARLLPGDDHPHVRRPARAGR